MQQGKGLKPCRFEPPGAPGESRAGLARPLHRCGKNATVCVCS